MRSTVTDGRGVHSSYSTRECSHGFTLKCCAHHGEYESMQFEDTSAVNPTPATSGHTGGRVFACRRTATTPGPKQSRGKCASRELISKVWLYGWVPEMQWLYGCVPGMHQFGHGFPLGLPTPTIADKEWRGR